MARKTNRHYSNEEWLEYQLDGELASQRESVRDGEHEVAAECYDAVSEVKVSDIEISGDLAQVKEDYERDVRKAITEWVGQYRLAEDWDVDDIMTTGAPGDVYKALDGSGASVIYEGEWDQYFTDSDYWENETLVAFLQERVGKYIDDTGGGSIPNEMGGVVYEAFVEACRRKENPAPAPRANPVLAARSPLELVRKLKF